MNDLEKRRDYHEKTMGQYLTLAAEIEDKELRDNTLEFIFFLHGFIRRRMEKEFHETPRTSA